MYTNFSVSSQLYQVLCRTAVYNQYIRIHVISIRMAEWLKAFDYSASVHIQTWVRIP